MPYRAPGSTFTSHWPAWVDEAARQGGLMWVIYQKSDRKVVGLSADSDIELDKDKAFQEVVKGLNGSPDPSLFDAFQVKERGKGHDLARALARGTLKVQDTK